MSNSAFSLFSNQNFVDCTLYQFGWEQCTPFHSFGPAARNHFLFHYITSGNGTLHSTDSKGITTIYHLHAGQGFFIFPGQVNFYIADEYRPWEYAWVEFDGLKAQEFVTLSGLSADTPVYNSGNAEFQQTMKEEMFYIANHGSSTSLNLIGHLYLFLDALTQSSNRRKTVIGGQLKDFYAREAITFIEHNYKNPIRVEDIAAFCNLNRSYFGKIFKDVISITPQEFLIRYRMTKACEYLETTDRTIGDISNAVGYPSQLHFSRAFKNTYSMSPRAWRLTNQVASSKLIFNDPG